MRRRTTMRVMVILKAFPSSEAGVMPKMEDIERGIRFNEEMVKAGILKGADGLKPSKFGKRITFGANGKQSFTDGPFAETKELVAGYWIWEVKSMDEALEWAKRIPDPSPGEESDIEIRPFFGPEDFGEEFTTELQGRVDEMHRTVDRNPGEQVEGRTDGPRPRR
jgi:hypothetical protein